MARTNANPGLVPSLLDRLIDPDADGTSWQRGYSPRQLMESVRRDLEDLFNTHRSTSNVPEAYTLVLSSIVAYGLPDLPSLYENTKDRMAEMPRLIAEIVTRHEPRLRDVRVIIAGGEHELGHRVRFQIEAGLNVDPSPEVAFETVLELATGQTTIRMSGA